MNLRYNIAKLIGKVGVGIIRSSYRLSKKMKRTFDAAKVNRLYPGSFGTEQKINQELRTSIRKSRNRARDLGINNPVTAGYLTMDRAQVIGHEGFKLQVKGRFQDGKLDDKANDFIENTFKDFSRAENFTVTKRWSKVITEFMLRRMAVVDGEFIVRLVYDPDFQINDYGFSQEILDADDLDETFNEELPNGNVVVNGVEFNEWKQIVNLHFRKKSLYNELYGTHGGYQEREAIPYKDLIYYFDPTHPKQARGLTKLASVMLSVYGLERWESASLTNATASAKKMGFLMRKQADAAPYKGADIATGNESSEDEDSELPGKYMDFEDAIIEELPYGYEYALSDPKFPVDQHEPFVRAFLRKISSALGVNYNKLANDLVGVNYSSLRSGSLTEQDTYRVEQRLFIELYETPLYEKWLKWMLFTNKQLPYPYESFRKFKTHEWQPRGYPWVDPLKEIEASKRAIKMGWTTNTKVAKEIYGMDYRENLKQIKQESEWQKEEDFVQSEDGGLIVLNINDDNGDSEASNGNGNGKAYKDLYKKLIGANNGN